MDNNKYLLANNKELTFFGVLGFLLIVTMIISFILGNKVQRDDHSSPSTIVVNPFEGIELTARAAYVYDARTNEVLYSKNSDERLPLASVTKVMTGLVAKELAPDDTTVVVTREALQAEGDSGLYAGERWSLKKLLEFSLTNSSNDGMRAVALTFGALNRNDVTPEEIRMDFVRMMNEKATELNLKNTYYFNETGLDESNRKGGAYGSAKDMAMLFDYILRYHPDLFDATSEDRVTVGSDSGIHTATNTNIIVDEIPGIIASKTGLTDIAGGNLVIAFDPELGRPIIISVLGSTGDDRFKDIKALVQATLRHISTEESI